MRKNRKGFTLIELVIVIAILGILALYAVPKYQGLIEEARSAEARAQVGSFRSALAIYYAKNHGVYPPTTLFSGGNGGSLFAEGVVPEVEVTIDTPASGTVNRSSAVDTTSPPSYDGGWYYTATTGKVILNSDDVDAAASPTKYWYEY